MTRLWQHCRSFPCYVFYIFLFQKYESVELGNQLATQCLVFTQTLVFLLSFDYLKHLKVGEMQRSGSRISEPDPDELSVSVLACPHNLILIKSIWTSQYLV